MTRVTRLVTGLFGYYVVSLILVYFLKWIPGAGGTITSCFLQMFYVSFIFPWCRKSKMNRLWLKRQKDLNIWVSRHMEGIAGLSDSAAEFRTGSGRHL